MQGHFSIPPAVIMWPSTGRARLLLLLFAILCTIASTVIFGWWSAVPGTVLCIVLGTTVSHLHNHGYFHTSSCSCRLLCNS
jgi:uncharacterized membrane-anchored protein YitT (DUF2179 family)